jgi:hypothetical protein
MAYPPSCSKKYNYGTLVRSLETFPVIIKKTVPIRTDGAIPTYGSCRTASHDVPEHATLLPAPPEASYSLPASPEADSSGGVPRREPPPPALSPDLAAELTAAWPDLQALAHWWHERQRLAQQDETPDRKLVRQTYHIEQRYIDAVRREADRTGESYAAVVNRAFARYFAGR